MTEQIWAITNRLLSRRELAKLLRVERETITTWATRYVDFPQPVRSGNAEYYWLEDIARWGDSRPVQGSEPLHGEHTYGQRLRREAVRFHPVRPSVIDASQDTQRRYVDELLGPLAGTVRRGPGSRAGYPALLMCLVFLRCCTSNEWSELSQVINARDAEPRPDVLLRLIGDLTDRALRERGVMPGARSSIERLQPRSTHDLREVISRCDGLGTYAFAELLGLFAAESRLGAADSFTPSEVALLMAHLVAPEAVSKLPVYDPYLRGGELLDAVRKVQPSADRVALHGASPNPVTLPFAGMSIILNDDKLVEFRQDSGTPWNESRKRQIAAGAVLLNPPFNMPVDADFPEAAWPFGVPPADKSDFAWLQHAVTCLAPGARAAVLMPRYSGAAGDQLQRNICTKMVEAGSVEAIVMLPGRLFPGSTANVNLWIVGPKSDSPGRVLFVDALRMVNKSKTGSKLAPRTAEQITALYRQRHSLEDGERRQLANGGRAVMANPDVIRSKGYSLNPADYLGDESSAPSVERQQSASGVSVWDRTEALVRQLGEMRRSDAEIVELMSAVRSGDPSHGWTQVPLKEVCDLKAGPSFQRIGNKQRTEDGTVPIVMPKHLRSHRIAATEMEKVSAETARKLDKFWLVPGDILCVRSGAITVPAIVQQQNDGWLYGTNLIRLRLSDPDQMDANYLLGFLSLPEVQEWMRRQSTRTATSSISTESLGHLQVTCPPIETQRKISAAFNAFDVHVAVHRQIAVDSAAMRADLGRGLVEGSLIIP